MVVIDSCAIENNLVYFYSYTGWVYDYDSFLVLFSGWLMIIIVSWAILSEFVIMIVSWAIDNNLIYLRTVLVCDYASFIGYLEITYFTVDCSVIVSWAIENNLVYFRGNSGLACDYDSFLGY